MQQPATKDAKIRATKDVASAVHALDQMLSLDIQVENALAIRIHGLLEDLDNYHSLLLTDQVATPQV